MTEFEEGNLPKDFSPELIDYMEKTAQEIEINYMKNGLSKEEVELRKKKVWTTLSSKEIEASR